MITVEQAKGHVEALADTYSDIELDERGFLRAQLLNPSSLDISIIVHPDKDMLVLRLRAQNIGSIDLGETHEQILRRVNAALVLGRIAIDNDGKVYFELNHPCLDGGSEDPGTEVFGRLLQATTTTARDVARIVMSMRLQDARVPQDTVEKILTDTFGAGNDQDDQGEML